MKAWWPMLTAAAAKVLEIEPTVVTAVRAW